MDVADNALSPIDLSIEAALELGEMKQGVRDDAPALKALIDFIRTPRPAYLGKEGMSMLADLRAYPLLRDSLRESYLKPKKSEIKDFSAFIQKYLNDLEVGVASRREEKIVEAKRFCMALNSHLLAKQMTDIFHSRDRTDMRSIANESLF